MILEIALGTLASLTMITAISLRFVAEIDRRDRAEDEAERKRAEPPEPLPPIYPFDLAVGSVGGACHVCGTKGANGTDTLWRQGPGIPAACLPGISCRVRPAPHLHVFCKTCNSRYVMAARPITPPSSKETSHEQDLPQVHPSPPVIR